MTPAAERRPLLPFAWARAHHLVLLSDGECCEALCRPDTAARALLEARRLALTARCASAVWRRTRSRKCWCSAISVIRRRRTA